MALHCCGFCTWWVIMGHNSMFVDYWLLGVVSKVKNRRHSVK